MSEDLSQIVANAVEMALSKHRTAEDRIPDDRIAYTLKEAGRLIGVQWYTLRDAAYRGELLVAKVGKQTLVERDELLSFLRRQRCDARA